MQPATPVAMTELRAQAIAPRNIDMPVAMGFGNNQSFELMQRAAKLLANSTLVPVSYRLVNEDRRGNVTENPAGLPNCVVALNMAQRMGADPLMVMQNLYIVEGRPAWSSQFIIAAINNCGRYSPLRFDMSELEPEREVEYTEYEWQDQPNGRAKKVAVTRKTKIRNRTCIAWAVDWKKIFARRFCRRNQRPRKKCAHQAHEKAMRRNHWQQRLRARPRI